MKQIALIGAALLAAGGAGGVAIARAEAADAAAIGPAIGSRIATDARLVDSKGRATTLAAIGGGKPMMIVMFRSAAWCPYCQAQLKGLGPVAAAARQKGVKFLAVSYDKPEALATFAAKTGLSFPLYSDSGSRMIDALKLRDPQYKADSFAYGVPYPTTMVVDASGRVKAKAVETDYKIRPSQADLIAMLDKA